MQLYRRFPALGTPYKVCFAGCNWFIRLHAFVPLVLGVTNGLNFEKFPVTNEIAIACKV